MRVRPLLAAAFSIALCTVAQAQSGKIDNAPTRSADPSTVNTGTLVTPQAPFKCPTAATTCIAW
jgi:hypothetical protein